MHTFTVDSKGRLYLGKLVSKGETWAAERSEDRIELVRLVKSGAQGKRRLRLEGLSRDELRDLVRLARLSKRDLAAAIRSARKSAALDEPGAARGGSGVSPSKKSGRPSNPGERKTPDA